jgi:hypothetical protein
LYDPINTFHTIFQYTKQQPTIILSGFTNYKTATIITDENNVPLTIKEWLLTVPDYHNKELFTNVKEINDCTLELQTTASNFAIAMKWARKHLSYIKQVLRSSDIEYAIQIDDIQATENIEEWETQKPPEIKFYSRPQSNTIPKTITGTSKSSKQRYHNKQLTAIDNQTIATANTVWSSSQNEMSDLHSDSKHQLSLTHESRMNQLETLMSTNIQEINISMIISNKVYR